MTAPSVVVGISTYNRAVILRKSIQSALDQSHRPLRIFVIDDASVDETPKIRDEFATATWERWEVNGGHVRARNKIMLTSPEDYYVSLDDDAWFLRGDEVALAVDYMERHPKVAAVAFDILSPERAEEVARGATYSVGMFIGCGHVLRLSVVRRLAGYDLFPGSYGVEEKDLSLRLIDAGYEIVKVDGVHVWHDKTTMARDIPRQHRSGVCNDLTLTVRRFPASLVLQAVGWKLLSHVVFAARNGLLIPCLRGIVDFIRVFSDAWRKRRPVAARSVSRYKSLAKSPKQTAA